MKRILSSFVFLLCCVAAGSFIFVAITQLPYAITKDSEGWGSMIFMFYVAPLIGGGSLLFGVIPSGLLYWRGRKGLDRISLYISSITLGLVVLTWVLIEPVRHWMIFERYRPPGLKSEQAAPNGGPAELFGNSNVSGGPPSVT